METKALYHKPTNITLVCTKLQDFKVALNIKSEYSV